MNPEKTARKAWLFRIYEWPLSFFVGLLIGSAVAIGFAAWNSSLRMYLDPTGILLYLGGWAILMASLFGTGMDQFIDRPPPTRFQKVASRSSIVIGIALNAIAWTFFTTPTETRGRTEQRWTRSGTLRISMILFHSTLNLAIGVPNPAMRMKPDPAVSGLTS